MGQKGRQEAGSRQPPKSKDHCRKLIPFPARLLHSGHHDPAPIRRGFKENCTESSPGIPQSKGAGAVRAIPLHPATREPGTIVPAGRLIAYERLPARVDWGNGLAAELYSLNNREIVMVISSEASDGSLRRKAFEKFHVVDSALVRRLLARE